MSLYQPKNACYRLISLTEQKHLPAAVTDWIQAHKMRQGQYHFHWMAKEYVLLALGKRPNPGYQMKITELRETSEGIVLHVLETKPVVGMVYPQVFVYPYLLLEVYQPVIVKW